MVGLVHQNCGRGRKNFQVDGLFHSASASQTRKILLWNDQHKKLPQEKIQPRKH